jgi:hypothetical protein
MAEASDNQAEGKPVTARERAHVQHVAALIVQRAFIRRRLQKAKKERLEAEDIAARLSHIGAECLHGDPGTRSVKQLFRVWPSY